MRTPYVSLGMDLPPSVLEQFRRHGRRGGKSRAARMSAAERSEGARLAATKRWIRERFGSSDFASLGLPGGELIDKGIEDLAAGKTSRESLVVSLAAPRLRREGIPVGRVEPDAEVRLYHLLEESDGDLAHARYNAVREQVVSFANACRLARLRR
ncbi:MAG: hypothetical protein ABL963_08385 [Longimicrobiales bacterium]